MTLQLRPAEISDAYVLWLWANDLETRRASGRREAIAWDAHLAWLRARVDAVGCRIALLEQDGRPLGTIRFETGDDWSSARLSYTVAPEARSHGYGRELLVRGIARLRAEHPRVRLEASVQIDNPASRRLLERLGWQLERQEPDVLHFASERRPAPCPE